MPISREVVYTLIQKCTKKPDLGMCRRVEALIVCSALYSIPVFADHLVRLFSACESLVEANQVFCKVTKPSEYTWNAIIDAHAKLGELDMAFQFYDKMQHLGTEPDKFTFLSTLKGCSSTSTIEYGRKIHEQIAGSRFQLDIVLGSTLVGMYAKCQSLEEACMMFHRLLNRDVVSWSALISGYAQHGKGFKVLECFENMQIEGIVADEIAYLSILRGCGCLGSIQQGRNVHEHIIGSGIHVDVVMGSTLVDMYLKCGGLEEARKIFNRLPNRNAVLWGVMISGYSDHDEGHLALDCYQIMLEEGIDPDEVTFSIVLKGCSSVGAIEQGRQIHEQIIENKFQCDTAVGNTLVHMYAKCGSLEEACRVFEIIPNRNVISWSAMTAGYALLGEAYLAAECYHGMQLSGIEPNVVAFNGILTAFSHMGLVEEGLWYFKTMRGYHHMSIDVIHVSCMVDLLGRAGCFNEAENVLRALMQPTICIWLTLLNACSMHSNFEMGRRCFDAIVLLDPLCPPAYVLLSNICAIIHMEDKQCKLAIENI